MIENKIILRSWSYYAMGFCWPMLYWNQVAITGLRCAGKIVEKQKEVIAKG